MEIKLGYEIETGYAVKVKPSHIIVTGVTQLSGKTTTLEALIKRSGFMAIVFKTKVGETGFTEGTLIPPYFKERSDWQYVQALLEATLRERLKFERSWIIDVCKNANSLLEIKANIDRKLAEQKMSQLSRSVLTTLQAYFELVLPQLQYANFSRTLTMNEGINIMDLERFTTEIQSLVIRSVLETVLKEFKNTIVVMPEAWKFLPQTRGNPCKEVAESFIRQGATNQNYLWIDSQDMAGVDKTPLKQVSTWILGLQTERNEVLHTLDQIPLPKRQKPNPEDIMTLKLGHFIVCSPEFSTKVYVQPSWLDDKIAKKIALGKSDVKEVKRPPLIPAFGIPEAKALPDYESQKFFARVQQDLVEMRTDFFNKIQEQQVKIDKVGEEVMKLSVKPQVDVDEIVSKTLQKIPTVSVDKQEIINEVLKLIPRGAGGVTYEVAPLEKIQKDFLEETRQKILTDIETLNERQKKALKFIESTGKGTNYSEILERCFFLSPTSGSNRKMVSELMVDMNNKQLIRKDTQNRVFPYLKDRIRNLLQFHQATEQEVEQVYNHIVMELLK